MEIGLPCISIEGLLPSRDTSEDLGSPEIVGVPLKSNILRADGLRRSRSMRRVFFPCCAAARAKFAETQVLPSPGSALLKRLIFRFRSSPKRETDARRLRNVSTNIVSVRPSRKIKCFDHFLFASGISAGRIFFLRTICSSTLRGISLMDARTGRFVM